ncbi:CvpA family protein [Pedobacter alpinus]|uniref:CvpA family protein n=1 Tax=Pedobacter alpinus TaxID=1590643 RepID=A0ABW5TUE3_9SPHI
MFNYVDIILLIIILSAIYLGYIRGFILGFLEFLALAISILIAFLNYQYIATFLDDNFHLQERWLFPLSFIISLFINRLIIGIIIYWLIKFIPKSTQENSVNKLGGILPGIVKGFFYAAIIALIFSFIPLWPNLPIDTRESYVAGILTQKIETLDQKIAPEISEQVKQSISKLTIEPESDETIYLHFNLNNVNANEKYENHLLVLVNQERRKAGLGILARDTSLRTVARFHSTDMFKKGYFSHINLENETPFDRIKQRKIKYTTAGENLALAQTVEIAHLGLMNSPGHKANILNPKFGRVGIGIIDGGIYGLMVTQNFRN